MKRLDAMAAQIRPPFPAVHPRPCVGVVRDLAQCDFEPVDEFVTESGVLPLVVRDRVDVLRASRPVILDPQRHSLPRAGSVRAIATA
ncbi:hypothetical protein [Microbacterium thalassium]|uniref:Uncharacterized protein n=1 Tax=Microbacterium thalassium TaxID=362649 RepID=A0A7X0FLI6_9MICO|nr:hypothetical protein [Microbacterium thalassium]MBB6389750.1 hypothetical protein [Microbacterium thalassium]